MRFMIHWRQIQIFSTLKPQLFCCHYYAACLLSVIVYEKFSPDSKMSISQCVNVQSVWYQTVLTYRQPLWCQIAQKTFGTCFLNGLALLTFTYTPPLMWLSAVERGWGLTTRVENLKHTGTLVQNHATKLWSLQNITIMGINTPQKKQLHSWAGAISPMQIGALKKTKNG